MVQNGVRSARNAALSRGAGARVRFELGDPRAS